MLRLNPSNDANPCDLRSFDHTTFYLDLTSFVDIDLYVSKHTIIDEYEGEDGGYAA